MQMDKKKNIQRGGLILLLILQVFSSILCQISPRFQTKLYFEDAIGNIDSITIGFDVNATNETDLEFEESEDNTPFDSIFDVRARDPNADAEGGLYKVLVTSSTMGAPDPDNCLTGGGAHIFINCVYQPIKIWWDKGDFLDTICYRGAFITDQISWELTEVSLDNFPGITYCLSETNEAFFELTDEAFDEFPLESRLELEYEVEGQGTQQIYGLSLAIGPTFGYTPCYWITNTAEVSLATSTVIYPNPCQEFLMLEGLGIEKLKNVFLYDNLGKLLQEYPFEYGSYLNFSQLADGVYYLIGELEYGKAAYLGSFVKQ